MHKESIITKRKLQSTKYQITIIGTEITRREFLNDKYQTKNVWDGELIVKLEKKAEKINLPVWIKLGGFKLKVKVSKRFASSSSSFINFMQERSVL